MFMESILFQCNHKTCNANNMILIECNICIKSININSIQDLINLTTHHPRNSNEADIKTINHSYLTKPP